MQNFEQYEDESAGLTPGGSRSRPIADPNFIGYTYKGWDAVHGGGEPGSGQGEWWGDALREGGREGGSGARMAAQQHAARWGGPCPLPQHMQSTTARTGMWPAVLISTSPALRSPPGPLAWCSQAAGEGAAGTCAAKHQPAVGSL